MDQQVLMVIALVAVVGAAYMYNQYKKSGDNKHKTHALVAAAVAGIAALLYYQAPAAVAPQAGNFIVPATQP